MWKSWLYRVAIAIAMIGTITTLLGKENRTRIGLFLTPWSASQMSVAGGPWQRPVTGATYRGSVIASSRDSIAVKTGSGVVEFEHLRSDDPVVSYAGSPVTVRVLASQIVVESEAKIGRQIIETESNYSLP